MAIAAKVVLAMLGVASAEKGSDSLRGLQAAATATYVRGGTICGAAETDANKPPTTYICDCGTTGTASCSSTNGYIQQSVLSLSFCTTHQFSNTTCTVVDQTIAGTRKSNQDGNLNAGTGTYAGMTDGIGLGSANSGGYIGTASYLALTGSIKYNSNDFLTSTATGTAQVANLCVVPSGTTTATAHTTCGANRTATPGTFKFSLYGYTWGNDYAAAVTGKNYMVGRTKVCAVGGKQVKVNGVVDGTGVVGTSTLVTSVAATQQNDVELTYAFETKYMFGTTTACTADGTQTMGGASLAKHQCTPSGAKTVKITTAAVGASDCPSGGKGVFVDYAFEMADLNVKDRWFAYDPNIARASAATTASSSASTASTASSSAATTAGTSNDAQSIAAPSILLAALFSIAAMK